MRLSIFCSDLADAEADALCTSTNPRLSLVMGTGAAVRARGGFGILRACEALVAGGVLAAGTAHVTTAGELPHKAIIHCVASDAGHHSSPDIIAACVRNALACADLAACRTIAMPVFATGHAHVKFAPAVEAMAVALRSTRTSVEAVTVVINDGARAEEARAILKRVFGDDVPLVRADAREEVVSMWGDESW